jgi:hypothetical protein
MARTPWSPLLVAAFAAACIDPVHRDAVANLGPEDPSVAPGPFHRPGQRCTTCHGGDGPAESEFSVAGTIFAVRNGSSPVPNAVVTVTDALGVTRKLPSNEAGNFFVRKRDWDPAFRLHVVVEADDIRKEMATSIGRDGACATCHSEGGDATFMPGVYLREK